MTNPAERAKRPRGDPRGLREVWTAEQLRTFLSAASHHRLSAFFRVAAYTGARRGEVSNLWWADIDWDAPALRIKGSVGIIAGQRVEGTTKGGRERLVSLDAGTVDVLRALRAKQVEDQRALGHAWTETGHVFTSGDGVPINPDSMTALMAKTIRAYNATLPPDVPALPVARLHDRRHVHATHLLLAGVPVHVVADRLGHAAVAPRVGVLTDRVPQRTLQSLRDVPVAGAVEVWWRKRRFACTQSACERRTFAEHTKQVPRRSRCTARLKVAVLEAVA